jgi:hypothetical protein
MLGKSRSLSKPAHAKTSAFLLAVGLCLSDLLFVFDLPRLLGDALANLQNASVLRERLSLAKELAEILDKKVKELEEKNTNLKKENLRLSTELKTILDTTAEEDAFVPYRGALFKRDPKGGYRQEVYCPNCRMVVGALGDFVPYYCDGCGWNSTFKAKDFRTILFVLNKEPATGQ